MLNTAVGRVAIYGNRAFTSQVREALFHLQQQFPWGFSMVQRYIIAIEQRATPIMAYAGIGVRFERAAQNGSLPVDPKRYGALLVRMAVGLRIHMRLRIPPSARTQLLELLTDVNAMKRLGCEQRYYYSIWNQIHRIERSLRNSVAGT